MGRFFKQQVFFRGLGSVLYRKNTTKNLTQPNYYNGCCPSYVARGRVDMLTNPVAAARAVVATGAWVKSKHDMYLIRGSVGAQALFLPIRRRIKKKGKNKRSHMYGTGTA